MRITTIILLLIVVMVRQKVQDKHRNDTANLSRERERERERDIYIYKYPYIYIYVYIYIYICMPDMLEVSCYFGWGVLPKALGLFGARARRRGSCEKDAYVKGGSCIPFSKLQSSRARSARPASASARAMPNSET